MVPVKACDDGDEDDEEEEQEGETELCWPLM